jgi:hypothetical protein
MLIAMMSTLTIAGILLSVTSPAIMGLIESRDLNEEREACEELASQLRTSWSIPERDYNIGLFRGAPGNGSASSKKENSYIDLKKKKWKKSDNGDDPLIKMARMRDSAPADDDELTAQGIGGTTELWFNKRRGKRLILVGPVDEDFKQRYLVVSLMVPSHLDLTLPTAADTAADAVLFNALWSTSWDNPSVQIPADWTVDPNGVTTNRRLWNEMNRGRTNASRMVVVRVVQSKCQLIVNNDTADLIVNNETVSQRLWVGLPAIIVPATENAAATELFIDGTGATGIQRNVSFSTDNLTSRFSRGIPEGTLINIWKGTTTTDRVKVRQFFMEKNTSITVK